MAGITSIPGQDFGFDPGNNTQVLPLGGFTTVILVAGSELTLSIDDANVAEIVGGKTVQAGDTKLSNLSEWEQQQTLERIKLYGKSAGSTVMRARLPDKRDWIKPLRIVVMPSKTATRQADGSTAIGAGLADDIKGMTLHEAVVRIAQDQLSSSQRTVNSGAAYGGGSGEDWCGIFAWWCWQQAAAARGGSNPWGAVDHMKSPQKIINWALTNPGFSLFNVGMATAIAGYTPPPNAKITVQTPSEENPVLPGDIMIERHLTPTFQEKKKDPKTGAETTATTNRNFFTQWKHIGIVTSRITGMSGTFTTIEGNQGAPLSIKAYTHDFTDKLTYNTGDEKSRFAFAKYTE